MVVHLLLWLIPILIIPFTFYTARYIPLRAPRFVAYVILLVAALVVGLNKLQLSNNVADRICDFTILFMVGEMFWAFNKFKSKKVFNFLLVIFLMCYGAFIFKWIIAGPQGIMQYWGVNVIDSREMKSGGYEIKVTDHKISHKRTFVLLKKVKYPFLEKRVDKWATIPGYYKSEFSYKWSNTPQGVRVDLVADSNTIWTIGEGLQ